MSERAIQQSILLALGSRPGVRLWRQNAGRIAAIDAQSVQRAKSLGFQLRYLQLAPAGAADLTGILKDGRRIEVEVKSANGYMTQDQARWKEIIERYHGIYILARSAEEAVEQLP